MTKAISKQELKEMLLKINKRIPADFADDQHFYLDLGIDSLDLAEFVANVEQEFKIKIDDNKWEKLSSINAVMAFLEKELNNNE